MDVVELMDLDSRLVRDRGQNELWVGEGWLPLLAALNAKLRVLDPDYRVVQAKEKFGGLRFYTSRSLTGEVRKAFDGLVSQAESASWLLCEGCGRLGQLRARDGSIYGVRCESCAGSTWSLANPGTVWPGPNLARLHDWVPVT